MGIREEQEILLTFPDLTQQRGARRGVLLIVLFLFYLFTHVWHTVCSLSMLLKTNQYYGFFIYIFSVVFVLLGASIGEPCGRSVEAPEPPFITI